MKLTTKWKLFKSTIENFINDANDLLYIEKEFLVGANTEQLGLMVKNWIKSCENYLKSSFDIDNNELVIGFQLAKPYSSYLKKEDGNQTSEVDNLLDELSTKNKTLEYYLELLSISDAVIMPKLVDTETRAAYTRREIIELVLDKLYYLYNQKYYPIQRILTGNSIKATKETVVEIIEILEQKGFIHVVNNRSLLVQLSSKGKEYIEDKRSFDLITTDISPKEIEKVELVAIEKEPVLAPEPEYRFVEKQLSR